LDSTVVSEFRASVLDRGHRNIFHRRTAEQMSAQKVTRRNPLRESECGRRLAALAEQRIGELKDKTTESRGWNS
jgi:hypothetical protein